MKLPMVALVGRPNVGKSTLFNRIVGARRAVVHSEPGVTRDRLAHPTQWLGRGFLLVDTGGIGLEDESPVGGEVRKQAEEAVAIADVVLLCVDVTAGITPLDREVAEVIRKRGKVGVLVANKVDSPGRESLAPEFWQLGLGEPYPVSAEHGLGIGDLLDRVVALVPTHPAGPVDDRIRIAVVGRPNVGKSSLVNALVGEQRVIVTELPGTTRDAVDIEYVTPGGRLCTLVDTAGMRRRTRIDRDVERFSVLRALRAAVSSRVAVFVLDGSEPVHSQDRRVGSVIASGASAAVIAVNKWDLVRAPDVAADSWRTRISEGIGPLDYARLAFTSAVTGRGLDRLGIEIDRALDAYETRVPTPELNRVLEQMALVMPPSGGGRRLRILYATQVAVGPPTFVLFVNDPQALTPPVERFIIKRLRAQFGFEGTAVRLRARARSLRGRRSRTGR